MAGGRREGDRVSSVCGAQCSLQSRRGGDTSWASRGLFRGGLFQRPRKENCVLKQVTNGYYERGE